MCPYRRATKRNDVGAGPGRHCAAGKIFEAYEDGTIWEWDTASGGKPSSRIVYAELGLKLKLSRIGRTQHGIPWGIAAREALLFGVTHGEWTCLARIPLNQTIADFGADDRLAAVLVEEKAARCLIVDFEQGAISLETPISESTVFAALAASLLCFRENESMVRLVGSALDVTITAEKHYRASRTPPFAGRDPYRRWRLATGSYGSSA